MWLRGHISVFALGSVILLTLNLVRGAGGIWADTAIGAWAVLVVAHGILMIIARLLQELLSDEDNAGIRPASEMHWNTPSTWTLPQRVRERAGGTGTETAPPAPTALDPLESAAAAAARERKPPSQPVSSPAEAGAGVTGEDTSERVPWKAATDAAWLATNPRDTSPEPPPEPDSRRKTAATRNNEDDFTPLKFD